MVIGVEVIDSRLPAKSPFLAELADGLNNGAYVFNAATRDHRSVDFARHEIVLRCRTEDRVEELARGNAKAILDGDALAAVVLLVNAQPPGYGGLRAGQIVTTGSCTGVVPVPGPCSIEADFGALGRIELRFD